MKHTMRILTAKTLQTTFIHCFDDFPFIQNSSNSKISKIKFRACYHPESRLKGFNIIIHLAFKKAINPLSLQLEILFIIRIHSHVHDLPVCLN